MYYFPIFREFQLVKICIYGKEFFTSVVSVLTSYGLAVWGFNLNKKIFSSPQPSRPALVPTQPPIQWVSWFFPGCKMARA
jgi:hypothetical protein